MAKITCLVLVFWTTLAFVAPQNFRLQRNVFPTSYSLKLVPDMDGYSFEGEVTIFLRVESPITNITLNSLMLSIEDITLDQAYGKTSYTLDPTNEIMQVFYKEGRYIDPGEHVLNVKFTGDYGPMYGFYKFDPMNNNSRPILATKFSPNHARSAFPCFDEPYFKSTFSIRIVKPDDSWKAISNMREIGQVVTPNGIAVDFESTVPMSTYLLAWVITDYNYDEISHISGERNITLRFYNAEKKNQELREALKMTKKALAFFENYTDVSFPLPKLDSIAIPAYRSGGMEHYGLVVYHANAVFQSNPFSSNLYSSIGAYLLIFHEISHMWFGNLVTHQWYNDLWLTEGFARYMQYKAGEAILGEPFVKYIFQETKYPLLFQMDCHDEYLTETASYPRKLSQIGSKFGRSTYDQGGALLSMLEDLIGEEKFREVIKKHVNGHKYGHSTTGQFIDLMESAAPTLNIRDFMKSFLFQKRLPLVNVSIENDYFVLQQMPFCNADYPNLRDTWTIPIRYITSSNTTSRIVWFDRDMSKFKIPKNKDDTWIQLNHLRNGLYRTLYSKEIYESMATDIRKLKPFYIGPYIEEAFLMTSEGIIECDIPLTLIGALKSFKGFGYLAFAHISRSMSLFLRYRDDDPEVTKILRAYFFDIFEELYEKMSWKVKQEDTMDTRLLRIAVLESFCLGEPKYGKCFTDLEALRVSKENVHPDLGYIYKAVLSDSKKLNTTMVRNITGQTENEIDMNPTKRNCITWIKNNIPNSIGLHSI